MTDAAGSGVAGAAPPRERGWWRVLLATLLVLFLPVTPMLRILLPVDDTLLLVAPALAACALVGWWAGGRLPLAVVWTALTAWVLWQLTAGEGTVAFLACGWAVMLAASFGALSIADRREPRRPFLPRALAAMAFAALLAGATALVVPHGGPAVREALRVEVNRRATDALAEFRNQTRSTRWRELAAKQPFADTLAARMEQQLQAAPGHAVTLFPALLALESLASLALAWALYHRVGRARLGPPLAPLREFRFNDQLVWGLIAGLVVAVVPWFAPVDALGANLIVFFGALYAVRGLGIVLWFLSPGKLAMALLIVFAVLFWHVLGALALGLGVGDTWLDWRRRAKARTRTPGAR